MKRLTRKIIYLYHNQYHQRLLTQVCLHKYIIIRHASANVIAISRNFSSTFATAVPTIKLNHSSNSLCFGIIASLSNLCNHNCSQNQGQLVNRSTSNSRKFCSKVKAHQPNIKMPATTPSSENGDSQPNQVHGYQKIQIKQEEPAPDVVVDLRSDTITLPAKGMREAIYNAVLGDDVFGEDPTATEFEARIAQLFQKEAAILVTSGTQANLISALVHCNVRGSEMICGDHTHMFKYEQGNISQFGGIHSAQIANNPDGTFSLEQLKLMLRSDDIHYPITKLVCVENTHNRCGGAILPLEWLDKLAEICKEHNVPIHMDGARVFNASVASGIPVSRIVRDVSSVSICLSKGLGAPAGSVIAGSKAFVDQARRMRKALGGGIRQYGIIAAGGLYCLDNMITRLKEDHENAKLLAEIINSKDGKTIRVDTDRLQTNILILQVNGCPIEEFIKKLAVVGKNEQEEREECDGKTTIVRCFPWSATSARLVTHVDITKEMARRAALKICYLAKQI